MLTRRNEKLEPLNSQPKSQSKDQRASMEILRELFNGARGLDVAENQTTLNCEGCRIVTSVDFTKSLNCLCDYSLSFFFPLILSRESSSGRRPNGL